MSSEEPDHVDKGKQRAQEPTERSPLLGTSSQATEDFDSVPLNSRRRLRSKLTTVFLVSLSICTIFFGILALFAWSYASRASHLAPEDIINRHLIFVKPNHVDILNITADGNIWLNVGGRIGLDAGSAIRVGSNPQDNLFKDLWKSVGRWGIRRLERVSVHLSTITISPEYDLQTTLVAVDIPPIEVPLAVDPPHDRSWLTPFLIPVHLKLTNDTTLLLKFFKDSWLHGSLAVSLDVGKASIRGGSLGLTTWRSVFHSQLSDIRASISFNLPSFPGFPHPGKKPLPSASDTVTLKSFNVSSISNAMVLHAIASIVNPLPPCFGLSAPSLPFSISIPDERDNSSISVASVSTSPFSLTYPNTTLLLSGAILPISSSSFPILSQFITHYLSGEANTVIISTPLFPNLHVEAEFPAPKPRPRLLRNVTIKDMKIKPFGTTFLASGLVQAHVVLPKGVIIGLNVSKVLPEVIIFDGEVPPAFINKWGNTDDLPPKMPLPNPLPKGAFGHIRPMNWLPSVSKPIELEEGEGSSYAVSARVVDVPLDVLPGRETEFGDFVRKVIFGSQAAVAGILGSVAVTVAVDGLPVNTPDHKAAEIAFAGLPVQGRLVVGKQSFFTPDFWGA